MNREQVIGILKNNLYFSDESIKKLYIFEKFLIKFNNKYNLIAKSTEKIIWERHFLDSAQILKHFDYSNTRSIADLGTGAGFPGLVLAIFNKNYKFHVKLYEKSPVKRQFLNRLKAELGLKYEVLDNIYNHTIDADIITFRAFKKIEEIIKISREIIKKSHKMIILKGKQAKKEIKDLSLPNNYSYKFEDSMTDKDSKIIVMSVIK